MRHPKASTQLLALALMGTLIGAVQGCTDDGHDSKPVLGPSTLVLQLPNNPGKLRRPAVAFDHAKHTAALGEDQCKTCHSVNATGAYSFDYPVSAHASRDEAMNAYHDACMKCHEDQSKEGKSTGPVTCGACHDHQEGSSFARIAPRFDYSLHARHSKAEKDECKACHHVYDEKEQKLVYKKGEENGCRDCHGAQDEGRNLSLRNASHSACINCHASRAAKGEPAGPRLCAGCHGAQQLASIETMKDIPRLEREQPDSTWLFADGATAALVPFDHEAHEKVTQSCSSCHHKTVRACKECHTVVGKSEGGFVTLERAYHNASSTHSCVGCHAQQTREANCAGCHHAQPQSPQQSSCERCHTGPAGNTDPKSLPTPSLPPVQLAGLPLTSDDFPEELTLEYWPGGNYGPVKFPHRKIVERLDRAARDNKLAARFHGQVETLCAGCHHNTPLGSRPPKCASCHAAENEATHDRPGLKPAFHRQCVECHQQMEIKAGCTDCHAEASKEGKQ
jgi:Class III cytochrome C family